MNNTLELQIKTAADGAIQSVKVLNQNLDVTNKNLINASSNISKAFSFGGAYASMKKFGKSVISMMNDIVNRTEELNLFNVVFKNTKKDGKQMFSELGQEAIKFQNTLNQKFGTNMTESLRYQSLYQSMGENVGIDPKYAAIISENTTKFAYDLASLYNTSEKAAADALKSGVFAGQVKPMRNYGVDLTEKSLSGTLLALGITDRTVSQMSQAEKEILRYITTLNQARIAMGDFADNIESPANQMKILNNLLTECKVAISSLFINTFAKILPYINAFLMVIKNIAYSLAALFGIEIRDYNSGISGLGEDFVGIEDGASGAADAVKELKRQTLGFDQINNLTEDNSKNNGYGSGGISGGIDQRLLDAITGYDNKMKDIKSKAQEISENIMKWLGFTSETDATTGELSWKFDHITGGTVLGALAVGGTIFVGIKTIFNLFERMTGLNLFTNFSGLIPKIIETVAIVKGGAGTLTEALELNFPKIGKIVSKLGLINPKLLIIIASIATLSIAFKKLYDTNEEFRKKVDEFVEMIKKDMEPILKDIKEIVGSLLNNAFDLLKKIWDEIIKPLAKLLEDILKPILETILDVLKKLWENVITPLEPFLKWLVDTALKNIKKQLDSIIDVINIIIDIVDWLWIHILEPLFKWVVEDIKNKITPAIEGLQWVVDKVKNAIQAVVNWWNNLSFNKKNIEVNYSIGGGGSGSLGGGGAGGRANGGIYFGGSWHNIEQYANGGAPSHGTLFAAGENGAEVVGHINGRTEVLNQSQMASVMYSAVSSAMANNHVNKIELYAHTDEGVIIDRINQKTNQTGVCPINIPY